MSGAEEFQMRAAEKPRLESEREERRRRREEEFAKKYNYNLRPARVGYMGPPARHPDNVAIEKELYAIVASTKSSCSIKVFDASCFANAVRCLLHIPT